MPAMSFAHSTLEKDGHTLDILTEVDAGLRIMVSRLGAELVSLAKQEAGTWTGFLYRDGDVSKAAEGWNNHSTVMGYFVHRIKDERSAYRGQEIRGGTHSFLRHKRFEAPEFDPENGSLRYRLSASQIAPEEYPGNVSFCLEYRLEHGALKVTFGFENHGCEQSAHVSFGVHPGFAVDNIDSAEVILPSGTYVRHMAPGNFLSGETELIEHSAGSMPFDKAELPGAFLLELKDVPVPVFEMHSGKRRISLGFEEAPYVTLWSDLRPFVCIEPCWGLPDHHQQRPFEEKAGIQEIAPGGRLSKSFTIKPSLVS
jgi:galactose mutarotase-like enzyme